MCGIFGFFSFSNIAPSEEKLHAMARSIEHRGPDAMGLQSDHRAAVGNCRLSIIDPSDASNQPVQSDDGNIVVVQNGEIYNYVEIRDELCRDGVRFRTSGDTEVVLKAFEHWGAEFVTRLNGMFCIAIHDRAAESIWLYRDRLGVKPLYFCGGPQEGSLWFASEIKAILAAGIDPKPDMDALAQFFALNYIPPPATAFSGIQHVLPGHMAKLTPKGMEIQRYWDLATIAPEPDMSVAEAKAGLLQLLDDATRLRMRSDVPFGAFLSGGLDSASVVGFMSMYQSDPIRTFSIGFDSVHYDETHYARMAAKRFGTLHEQRHMSHDITALWPRFIWHVDQPHGDVSFIPTDQVSRLASLDVKMVLTGDGGDELFAGYEKYLKFFDGGRTDHLRAGWESQFLRQSGLLLGDEPEILLDGPLKAAFLSMDPYRSLSSHMARVPHQDAINQVLFADTSVLLPGNNLVKPDRMAMANSLEVRSPFLDYRMAEFAFRMPGKLKLNSGETKAIYKEAVRDLLGDTLTYRKKQMFTVPVGDWFRQTLARYCRQILLDGRLAERGIVRNKAVFQMVERHIAQDANYTRQLRALISLEIWFRLFVDRDPEWLSFVK